jgi:acetyltransferase
VRSNLKGQGIGWELMQHLIQYADAEGLRELHGNVLAVNKRMLQMSRDLGFDTTADPEDRSLYKVKLELPEAESRRHWVHSHPS